MATGDNAKVGLGSSFMANSLFAECLETRKSTQAKRAVKKPRRRGFGSQSPVTNKIALPHPRPDSPSSQGRVPALKRKPPGLLAKACAVQRKIRRHCFFKSSPAALQDLPAPVLNFVSIVCSVMQVMRGF